MYVPHIPLTHPQHGCLVKVYFVTQILNEVLGHIALLLSCNGGEGHYSTVYISSEITVQLAELRVENIQRICVREIHRHMWYHKILINSGSIKEVSSKSLKQILCQ